MPLTPEQRNRIRDHVYQHAVPRAKEILESGGFVPDDMGDDEAFAEVEQVLTQVRMELDAMWKTKR